MEKVKDKILRIIMLVLRLKSKVKQKMYEKTKKVVISNIYVI